MSKKKYRNRPPPVAHIYSEHQHMVACPVCFKLMDAVTGVGPTPFPTPFPGAVTLCSYCGALNVYDNDMQLRQAAEADIKRLHKTTRKLVFGMRQDWLKGIEKIDPNVQAQAAWFK